MHKEHFDFREGIWDDIDETFRDFVEEMVQERPENRLKIEDLLEHEFIQNFRKGQTTKYILMESNQGPMDSIMYKFYVAYIVNELVCNQIRIVEKKNEIRDTWESFWNKEKKELVKKDPSVATI